MPRKRLPLRLKLKRKRNSAGEIQFTPATMLGVAALAVFAGIAFAFIIYITQPKQPVADPFATPTPGEGMETQTQAPSSSGGSQEKQLDVPAWGEAN